MLASPSWAWEDRLGGGAYGLQTSVKLAGKQAWCFNFNFNFHQ